MTQLQEFLINLSFYEIEKIRRYMSKRYNVYCRSMKELEQDINDWVPDPLEELSEVLA